ncbi:ATP-binding cassette sub-family B member 10, mitochondrial-like [Hermetia illucens]|uniref:ATP-binding cassette sub-family B member 10, mitochondrial-like n=1 Tax=Hermetia illucens TaxID=343691 RepID=UPI0018CC607B|nr:ATP-binding cassette sub-family B member 10, mitochondrial-like [Hermetia illucens]
MLLNHLKTCSRFRTQFLFSRTNLGSTKYQIPTPKVNVNVTPARNFVNLSQAKKFTFLTRKSEIIKETIRQCSKEAGKRKKLKSSDVKRLLSLAKSEKWVLVAAIGFLLVSSTVTMAVPYALGKILDIIFVKTDNTVMMEKLRNFSMILAGVFILGGLANFGRVYLFTTASLRIVTNLREKLFRTMLSQEAGWFDKKGTGELLNRLTNDAYFVGNSLSHNLSDGLRSTVMVLAGTGMMIYTSPQLALVSTCVVPCVAGMAIVYGKFIRNITRILLDKFAEISKSAEERLSNVKTVKIFCREDQESEKYHNHLLEALQIGYREARAKASFFGLTGLSGNMIIMSVLYYGGTLVMSEQLSVGALTSFILYAGYTAISINGLSNFYTELNKGVGSAQRIWEIIDRKPLITHDAGIYPDEKPIGKIVFNNVQFNFPSRPDSTVLKQFNLTLEPGTTTAIVGRSGSGKTTIASLLLRLYDPLAGNIYLDGRNLRELNPNWLRDNIGAVNQEPVLFSGSVRENILYGAKPGSTVSAELFQKVIQEAHVDEFISKLPDGLDTLVGQRGMMLSGGQKQRVAIARALIKKPTILIFDEATSALDAVSEELVQNALEQMTKGRTVLTIAHRLSTIRNADNIVVLDDGRVVEEGSYEVLMQKDRGIFKGLVGKQAFDLPVAEANPSTEATRTTGQLVSGQNVNESFDKGASKTPSVSIE